MSDYMILIIINEKIKFARYGKIHCNVHYQMAKKTVYEDLKIFVNVEGCARIKNAILKADILPPKSVINEIKEWESSIGSYNPSAAPNAPYNTEYYHGWNQRFKINNLLDINRNLSAIINKKEPVLKDTDSINKHSLLFVIDIDNCILQWYERKQRTNDKYKKISDIKKDYKLEMFSKVNRVRGKLEYYVNKIEEGRVEAERTGAYAIRLNITDKKLIKQLEGVGYVIKEEPGIHGRNYTEFKQ